KGKVLMRAYVGKPTDQEIVHKSDEEIVSIVLAELKKVMDIEAEPLFTMVNRWQNQMPQYKVGHVETLDKLENEMREQPPGLDLAGSSYKGVGIPDCVAQGKEGATQVVQYLQFA